MVLINNLTVDEINAALIHLQRSRNEVVGGEKGDTVQNITINNQGGGADYSSVINAIENRLTVDERNLTDLDSSQRIIASQTAGLQEQVADIYNTLLSMSQNNITDISWDDANRVLVINTTSMSYEVAIPSETVALSLEGNVLTFTMGEQTTSVTLNYIPTSEKGAANGVATLDSSGRIPYSQLPESAMEFLGEWDASTNTPHLEDGTGDNGDFYVVSVGGTVNFGTQAEPRNITFYPNDRVVYEGSLDKWFRLPAGEVRTVNGLSGDVVLNGTNVNYDGTNNSPTLKSKIDSVETKANTQADWNISDSSNLAYIKNKPALKTVAVTGSYNDLTNKPTIPAAQIQSDWTQTDSTKKDFIKNKIPIWITQGSASDNMQPVDVVQEGNTKPVTSNAVAEIMESLPTDAVLHYSFDDVPDFPDGTAVYFRNKNFTTSDGWAGGSNVITAPNGILTVASVVTGYIYKNVTSGSIIKSVITSSVDTTIILYASIGGTTVNLLSKAVKANVPTEFIAIIPSGTLASVGFNGLQTNTKFEVLAFYIGNGSYTTPVIDNANGQNNGTNNGGIAVQGVSGKGVYFLQGKYAETTFDFGNNFSFSFWINPADNISDKREVIIRKEDVLLLNNGANGSNYLFAYLFNNSTIYRYKLSDNLLTPNVWQYIVITKNGTELKSYINGVLTKTLSCVDTIDRNNFKSKDKSICSKIVKM